MPRSNGRLNKQEFTRTYCRVLKVVARLADQQGLSLSEAAWKAWEKDNAKVTRLREAKGRLVLWTVKRAYIWAVLRAIRAYGDNPTRVYNSFAKQQGKVLRRYVSVKARADEKREPQAAPGATNTPEQAVLAVAIRPCEGSKEDSFMVYSRVAGFSVPVVTTTTDYANPRAVIEAALWGLSKLNEKARKSLDQAANPYQWP